VGGKCPRFFLWGRLASNKQWRNGRASNTISRIKNNGGGVHVHRNVIESNRPRGGRLDETDDCARATSMMHSARRRLRTRHVDDAFGKKAS